MGMPDDEKLQAEVEWFWRVADYVAAECGGSLTSGRRTEKRNASLPGADPHSLHMRNLAGDYVFDTPEQSARAWELGRSLGLHGYLMSTRAIHWQARPKGRG